MHILLPLPARPIIFKEECLDCGYETQHFIEFSVYSYLHHKVVFSYFCKDCYSKHGDQTQPYTCTMTVVDWKHFIREVDNGEDN